MSELFDELAKKHHGLLVRADLLQHATEGQIRWWVGSKRIFDVREAVYRLPGIEMTWTMQLRAALLAINPAGFVSHRAAARMWGFRVPFQERLEITVPRGCSVRTPDVEMHTSKRPNAFISDIDGLALSAPERTILEISRYLGDESLRRTIEDAAIRKIISIEHLQFAYDALRGRGVRRFSAFRRLLPELSPEIGSADTRDEVRAFKALVGAGLPAPEFRHRMIVNGDPIRMDLAYVSLKINVEMDDLASHEVLRFKRDRQRDRHLEALGWAVLRFPNDAPNYEIIHDVKATLERRAA